MFYGWLRSTDKAKGNHDQHVGSTDDREPGFGLRMERKCLSMALSPGLGET